MKNYLVVTEWHGRDLATRFDLIKGVAAQGSKGNRLATEYERDLNNGRYTLRYRKGDINQ